MHDGRERLLSVEMRNLNAEYRAIPLIYIDGESRHVLESLSLHGPH